LDPSEEGNPAPNPLYSQRVRNISTYLLKILTVENVPDDEWRAIIRGEIDEGRCEIGGLTTLNTTHRTEEVVEGRP